MSAAVWERKEAVRKAKAKGWNPQKATDILYFVAIGHIDLSNHPSGFEVGDLVFHHGEGHVMSLNDDGGRDCQRPVSRYDTGARLRAPFVVSGALSG